MNIGSRAVFTMTKNQGWGDLDCNYLQTRASKFDFNLASIPETFTVKEPQPLDVGYRKALFDFGNRPARHRYPWRKAPPDVNSASTRKSRELLNSTGRFCLDFFAMGPKNLTGDDFNPLGQN